MLIRYRYQEIDHLVCVPTLSKVGRRHHQQDSDVGRLRSPTGAVKPRRHQADSNIGRNNSLNRLVLQSADVLNSVTA